MAEIDHPLSTRPHASTIRVAGGERTIALALVALLTLAGLFLRLAAARGDLWLDEIWSFRLVAEAQTVASIVFALPYDNNHVLNSLWLAFVGPTASPLVARTAAVLFGSLLAPVAARAFWRLGPVAAVAAAVVFALDYTFVHFGSEARGYSGMILAVLIAWDALNRVPAEQNPTKNLVVVGGAVAFGTFSHLTMLEPTALLCIAAVMRLIQTRGLRRETLASAWPILLAAAAGTAPALLCLAISLAPGTLHIGLVTPFSLATFVEGLGRIANTTIGLPDGPIDGTTAMGLGALGLGVVWMLARVPPAECFFPALAILGGPAVHLALRIPNQQYPRFYLTVAIAFALLAVAVWSRAWTRGGVARLAALAVALAFLAGQAVEIATFLTLRRGHYAEAVAFLREKGPATFAVLPPMLAGETAAVVRWYAGDGGAALTPVAAEKLCAAPPTWLLTVQVPNERSATGDERPVPGACPQRFVRSRTFPAYGLSGFTWTVFARVD